jgi:hypothetical protein
LQKTQLVRVALNAWTLQASGLALCAKGEAPFVLIALRILAFL